ncbi:MAG: thiK [Gammaproteobacteria bacterium]|jgi:thiamine kinase|nr:thiK [Gammaproteobacteria bacterium]
MVEDLSDSRARELMLAEALAHVPGYSPAIETSELSGGSVNRSYEVSTPAGRFVLRLSRGPDAWLTADRSVERELHRIASDAGIAPRIVHANDRWLITDYVAGRLWLEPDFANPERLAGLGDTLRRLHQLPAPACGRFDLLEALKGYSERVGAQSRNPADNAAEYLGTAAAAWRISGAAERPLAILHHDLHGSNIIESGRALVLIDWECAAVSDPLLDIACILSYHESARPHASLLLQHSGLEEVTPRQLAASVWLFDLHTYLWYRERRMRLSPTGAELEAEHRLSLRLPGTLEDWRSGAS